MQVEIKGKNITITLPLIEKASKSGKNLLIASTGGNKLTNIEHKGKKVTVAVNCYVPVE
jgi:hypothetical protein